MRCALIIVLGQGLVGTAGGDDGLQYWWDRLAAVTGRYSRVLMLGGSMGATAALLFSPLATAVHAFTPQVRHAMMVLLLNALGTTICLHEGHLRNCYPILQIGREWEMSSPSGHNPRHKGSFCTQCTPSPATLAIACPLRVSSARSQSPAGYFELQVDLKSASLRPGKDNAWLEALTQRVMTSVSASEARMHVHSGSWLHDLDQVAQHSPFSQATTY